MKIYKKFQFVNQTLFFFSCAEVAELVDALGSGSSGCMAVRVRVSPSAPESQISRNLKRLWLLCFGGVRKGAGVKPVYGFPVAGRNQAAAVSAVMQLFARPGRSLTDAGLSPFP
jgi:hypothetical protein